MAATPSDSIPVVLPSNLGVDFDLGNFVPDKINVVFGNTTTYGKMRYATPAELQEGVAAVAIDAAMLKQALALNIPVATLTTPGVIIVGNYLVVSTTGVLSVNPTVELKSMAGQHLGFML